MLFGKRKDEETFPISVVIMHMCMEMGLTPETVARFITGDQKKVTMYLAEITLCAARNMGDRNLTDELKKLVKEMEKNG